MARRSKTLRMSIPLLIGCMSLACGGGEGGDSAGGSVQHPNCDAYVACVGEVDPAAVSESMESYGDSSPCWDDADSTETCETACASARRELFQQNPSSVECDDGSALPSSYIVLFPAWEASVTSLEG